MKWYDDSASDIKIEKIPYRLLKINDEVYDSIFERNGEYILSIKCGVAPYSKNHSYKTFITDGFNMIYELPNNKKKEIKLNLKNIKNFLHENRTIISSIPGSDISLNADINTEYIAYRELDRSIMIKYDNYSLKDFPMEKRNYEEKIIVERLINETTKPIGYEKNNKYYFDIKESSKYIEVVKNGEIEKTLKKDGNSIELPSELGNDISWNIEQGTNIVTVDTVEGESLKLIEIWGDTWQENFRNLYEGQKIELGKLWHSYGTIDANDRLYQTTPLIQIEMNTSYTFYIGEDSRYCLYDQQQQYISGAISNTFSSQNAKYVRICGKNPSYIQLRKTPNLSNIQHVGELYTDNKGRSILNREGNEQYKIEIESHNFPIDKNTLFYLGTNLSNYNVQSSFISDTDIRNSKFTIELECENFNDGDIIRLDNGYGLKLIKENKSLKVINFNSDIGTLTESFSFKQGDMLAIVNDGSVKVYLNGNLVKNMSWLGIKGDFRLIQYTNFLKINTAAIPEKDLLKSKPKINKTTVLLPCQLMKVGDISDKLYWNEEKNKYIIEKNITKSKLIYNNPGLQNDYPDYYVNYQSRDSLPGIKNIFLPALKIISTIPSGDGIRTTTSTIAVAWGNNDFRLLVNKSAVNEISDAREYFNNFNAYVYYPLNKPKILETSILEQKTLNCYNDRTYIVINNTNLSPFMKVKYPININNSTQLSLPRENNFDSILNVILEPKKNTNITFFEGGLDLKLTNGIEIRSSGEEYISKQDGKYASSDFIDLTSYTTSSFIIDTFDILLSIDTNKLTVFYYNKDKVFLSKVPIAFAGKFYKSDIPIPDNTKYCKVAVNLIEIVKDSYKIRILRNKYLENGFNPHTESFTNDTSYIKSFSSLVPIKHDIERLMVFSNNYEAINEFSIINNLDEKQKKHSYEIPKIIEPGETLSYTKSGKKQFAYKYNNTPFNSITKVDYTRPYKEYSNIADNIRFILNSWIVTADGSYVANASTQHVATEKYINVSEYKDKIITFSAALPITSIKVTAYRDSYNFIKHFTSNNNFVTFTVPSNCHYIRAECYLQTLAAQSEETKELIQKHVMVTLTDFRCDYVPYSVKSPTTVIPNLIGTNPNKYELDLKEHDRYLFIEPYKFEYKLKDINTFDENTLIDDDNWKLDIFDSSGMTGDYATLQNIENKTPYKSSVIKTPVKVNTPNIICKYTKFILSSNTFNLRFILSVFSRGSIYFNDEHMGNYFNNTPTLNLKIKKGINKLDILGTVNAGSVNIVINQLNEITSSLENIDKVGSSCELLTINSQNIDNKFNIKNIFFHNIIDGKLLTAKKDLNLRLESESKDKFIFAKDFTTNPSENEVVEGYIDTNIILKEDNSKTYINRVYGGEKNLTLLTIGGNICEIYFLNDYTITNNSYYAFHSKYTSGNQKILIDEIPKNARYVAVVTDKKNTGVKCSGVYLFPGKLERSIDSTSEYFETFDNFNKEIATLPYSATKTVQKNKLPSLSKLVLDSDKFTFDEINNRYIFPIELDKIYEKYYLQYWNDVVVNSLTIFVDCTESIGSETKKYLVDLRIKDVNHKLLELDRDFLNRLENNIMYLSVSIENSNKEAVYKFLIGSSYKLQLEKDNYTTEYEPYTEVIETHHPMYLTANGLTIESSSSYYGIRILEKPTNIKVISNNGQTNITWDEVIGASSYILYLKGEPIATVYESSYETIDEIKGMLTIRAQNSLDSSELSDEVFVHSVPNNPYIIYIDNIYSDNKYNFRVQFKDKSDIETGYNVRYKIDDKEEIIIPLDKVEGIGQTVEANFSANIINKQVIVRITSINEKGENDLASQFILKLPPKFLWTYDEQTKKIVMAWDNIFPKAECSDYAIRYKKKKDETPTTITIANNYNDGERIRYTIDLEPDDEMELALAGLKEEIYYVFTKPIIVSKTLDVTKIPPDDFRSKKKADNNRIVEYSWTDNSEVEKEWEISYYVNNSEPKTFIIPSNSKELKGTPYKQEFKFDEEGVVKAKLRMIWELGTSKYTEELTDYYFNINNVPPTGLRKKYTSRTNLLIEWDSQNYVESYVISIKKNEDKAEEINIGKNTYYNITLDDTRLNEYTVNVKTNFLGDLHSNYCEKPLKFKPTWSDNSTLTTINTKCEDIYPNDIKTIDKIRDVIDFFTKSTNNVSWDFPLLTASLNKFQRAEGLISTETWNTGQETRYNNEMIVKTTEKAMQKAILNTISYQITKYDGAIENFIYTPSSISGKIEMEINKTRIVCIGDSITAGHPGFWAESMTGIITHQYPYWLDRRLKFQYEVINKGYGSDRTFNVLARFKKDVLDLSPQYCLIQIGTNDIYWGAASAEGSNERFEATTLEEMKNNVKEMVDLCFKNNIVPIIGKLIPRTQVATDSVVKFALYAFNDWIVKFANETEGLNYVDFFNAGKDKIPATPLEDPKSPGAMNPIYDGDNVYDEMGNLVKYGAGIHLNAEGYRIMAEAIPLNLFNTIESGIKMYMDEKCTIEAEYNEEDKQNPFYEIEIDGMKLTRTKKIIRYIKNIGNTQVLFSIYPNDLHNLDYKFKFKETDEGTKTIAGILAPGASIAVRMELTPLTEDSKSSIELSLVSREFTINS